MFLILSLFLAFFFLDSFITVTAVDSDMQTATLEGSDQLLPISFDGEQTGIPWMRELRIAKNKVHIFKKDTWGVGEAILVHDNSRSWNPKAFPLCFQLHLLNMNNHSRSVVNRMRKRWR